MSFPQSHPPGSEIGHPVSLFKGLGHVASAFHTNAVDGAFLSDLSEEDLVSELGLTRLQARKAKARLPVA